MRVLAAENGMKPCGSSLKSESLDIVGGCHQVGFRRQLVFGVSPVGVAEGPKLSTVHKGLQALLHTLEINRAAHGGIAQIVGQRGGLGRVCLQGADDIHPIERMEMIEMDQMVMLELRAVKQVSNNARIFGDGNLDSVFNGSYRRQGMCVSTDPAGSLNKMVGIPGIPALKNEFDTSEHLT